MINSIQHFQEQGVKNLTEIFSHYTDALTKFAEMVYGVTKKNWKAMMNCCVNDRTCEKAGTLNAGMKRSF